MSKLCILGLILLFVLAFTIGYITNTKIAIIDNTNCNYFNENSTTYWVKIEDLPPVKIIFANEVFEE